jgi:hypothetical protein
MEHEDFHVGWIVTRCRAWLSACLLADDASAIHA